MGFNTVSEVNLLQQAKQGNITAISSLMNRLLKSQGMMAAVDQEENCLHILIESDRRSLDDDLRIPNRTVLVAMLKKWFVSLEVQKVSSLDISWQQTGQDAPAWHEVVLIDPPPIDETASTDETVLQSHPVEDTAISRHPVVPDIVIPTTVDPESAARSESFDDIFGNDPIGSINASDQPKDNELLQFALEPLPPLPVPEITPPPAPENQVFMLMDVPTNVPVTAVEPKLDPRVEPNVLTTNREQAASMEPPANLSIIDPAAAEAANVMHQTSESSSKSTSRGWLHTNTFLWQFGQYLVICGVIIGLVQGLHSALRPPKPDKANRPAAMEMVSRETVANTAQNGDKNLNPNQNLAQGVSQK
jgi:hypothetical protein